MNRSTEKLIGYALWRGGKWYVRHHYLRRLPSTRTVLVSGLGALAVTGVAVTLARRALS